MAEIIGVLLAAGFSTRFGASKLLTEIDGLPMIAHSAAALTPCDRIIAVVRPDQSQLLSVLQSLGVEAVIKKYPERGMGYSIASAIQATTHGSSWCILPADMPYVQIATTLQVTDALRNGSPLVVPDYKGQQGHPVGFSAEFRKALISLDGDTGARSILQQHADQLTVISTQDAGVITDIDTPAC